MKVAIIILFSVNPLIGTVFEPFGAMVLFNTGMYFEGVCTLVKIENERWWDVIIFDFFDDAMQIGFFELFFERVRNGNLSAVPSLLTKPILLNKLCAQHDCLRSM